MDEGAILALSVLKCPTGYWGGGDTIAARCAKCPDGSTTKEAGSTTLAECSGEHAVLRYAVLKYAVALWVGSSASGGVHALLRTGQLC
jgi:hypothetical protein